MTETYVTTAELAKHFRVAQSTIRKMVAEGGIPAAAYIRVGTTLRFDQAAVEAALRNASKKAGDETPAPQTQFDFNGEEK